MANTISANSRLRFQEFVTVDGFEFWDLDDLPTIRPQTDDILYRVRQTDRIDLLANQHYGNPVLWWVIAVANDMEILPTALNIGETIRIPSPRYVTQNLFTTAVNK
jgi:hypothetical protein